MSRPWRRFRGAKAVGEGGLAGVKDRAGGYAGGRRRVSRRAGSGFGLGESRLIFFLGKCRAWLGVDGFSLLLAKSGGGIDIRVGGRRGGFLLRGAGATVRDQALDGHDHGERLDLSGNAAAGHFGPQVGDFPEAGQDLFAPQVQPTQSLGFLLDELLLHGGAVLDHVGEDAGLGFGVSGGVGARWGSISIPPRRDACECLICDRDRVGHRTVVTLPFARV
jgi:hypothetical protein